MAWTDKFLIETPTSEGLNVVERSEFDGTYTISEVGHFGYVICEYRVRPDDPDVPFHGYATEPDPGVLFLVERLADLEDRCARMARETPVSIDLQRWKYNRRAAVRRLRRWLREHENQPIEIPEKYQEAVRRVRESRTDPEPDLSTSALIDLFCGSSDIDQYGEYVRRRSERVPLVLRELPDELRALLNEANQAYCHGLFRAAVALCRSVLEDVLVRVTDAHSIPVVPSKEEGWLQTAINAVPEHLLPQHHRIEARKIRITANETLHEAAAEALQDEAWEILSSTGRIVETLVNRGGLRQD